jgi:uncharacterized protein YxeA
MKRIMTTILSVLTLGITAGISAAEKNDLPQWQDPFVLQ